MQLRQQPGAKRTQSGTRGVQMGTPVEGARCMTSTEQHRDTTELDAWLDAHAEAIDASQELASEILPRLGRAGVFRIGVPARWGGTGENIGDAIEAVARVAGHSLAAAFVFWGQRTFIEYVLQSANETLRTRWLDALLSGELAGATGLSN